jgi:hypothetical protein
VLSAVLHVVASLRIPVELIALCRMTDARY